MVYVLIQSGILMSGTLFFYPIELDRLTNQLEKTEKKIKEADHGIYVAKDEIQNLNRNIADKEIQLKINEQNFGPKSAELTKESAKYAFTFIFICFFTFQTSVS